MEKLFEVGAGNFVPPPKVDSAVVYFRTRTEARDPVRAKAFLGLISKAFAQPRKKVISNLVVGQVSAKETLETLFGELGIRIDARAEMIGLDQWKSIFERLSR